MRFSIWASPDLNLTEVLWWDVQIYAKTNVLKPQ